MLKKIITAFLGIFITGLSYSSPIPPAPNLNVKSYVLLDFDSNMILASSNGDLTLPPASITKMMTVYLAFTELKEKNISMNEDILVSEKAWKTGGSKMFIEVGKKIKVKDILQGVITVSGNDASVALAEHISGDEKTFATYMNQMAQNIGLENTNYTNATGLPSDSLYTTAEDIAKLSRSLIIEFPDLYKMYSTKSFKFNDIKQYSRNKLLFIDDNVDGIKTGFTKAAGYCLASSAKRGSRRLIAVVMGAPTPDVRIQASRTLLEYGFRFFETHTLFKSDTAISSARVFAGEETELKFGLMKDATVTIPRRQKKKLKYEYIIDRQLTAPVKKNEIIGFMNITLDGEVIKTYKLSALENINQGSLYRRTIDSLFMDL
ncbi:MAG: D-alanyl-D-alanine carboxypeptidase family protein [Gammaproteobacteria bacterium]|jgi:D-alanyl-D-alanine carboxypeptidase (penicillin-binding protein 5/6)